MTDRCQSVGPSEDAGKLGEGLRTTASYEPHHMIEAAIPGRRMWAEEERHPLNLVPPLNHDLTRRFCFGRSGEERSLGASHRGGIVGRFPDHPYLILTTVLTHACRRAALVNRLTGIEAGARIKCGYNV